MPRSDILAGALMLVGVALAYFLAGETGATIALVLGTGGVVFYFMSGRTDAPLTLNIPSPLPEVSASPPLPLGTGGGAQLVMEFPRGIGGPAMDDPNFWILRNVGGRAATRINIQDVQIGEWKFQFEPIPSVGPSGHGADVVTVQYTTHKGQSFLGSNKPGHPNPAFGLKSALASECDLLNGPVLPLTINYKDEARDECIKQVIYYGTFDAISVHPEDCQPNQPSSPDQRTLDALQNLLPNEGGIMQLRDQSFWGRFRGTPMPSYSHSCNKTPGLITVSWTKA